MGTCGEVCASRGKYLVGTPLESHGKLLGDRWRVEECCGEILGESWGVVGKPLVCCREIVGKLWGNRREVFGSCEKVGGKPVKETPPQPTATLRRHGPGKDVVWGG